MQPHTDAPTVLCLLRGTTARLLRLADIAAAPTATVPAPQDYPPGTVTCSGLLGRDHMFFRDGHFVKRLQYLPRDMNRVVLVDADVETYKWNPRNTLLVKPYKEYDPKDTALQSATKMILGTRWRVCEGAAAGAGTVDIGRSPPRCNVAS